MLVLRTTESLSFMICFAGDRGNPEMEGHYRLVLIKAEVYKVRIDFSNRRSWPNLDIWHL